MRMFGYYIWHSFINQLRKLLKTWIVVFILVCALIGGCIGIFVGSLSDQVESEDSSVMETIELQEVEPAEDAEVSPGWIDMLGVEKTQALEFAFGVILLGLLVWQVLSADKNGTKLFLPADVNLLFASPMKPQSVLMFRLATQMGVAIFIGIYMLLQIPNLMNLFGMSGYAAAALLLDIGFAFGVFSLIKVLIYLLCSRSKRFQTSYARVVYGLLAVLGIGYFSYLKQSGMAPLTAAVYFFNAPFSRWIPLWGWLKAFPIWIAEGNTPFGLLSLLLIFAGAAALLVIIRHTEADFYEDAMTQSEEKAAAMQRLEESRAGRVSIKRRKKDRGDGLQRDGLTRGAGASMFFYKTMYNRFRFAHLHIFTKTSETYLAAALGLAALSRFVLETDSPLPLVLGLGAFAFFRALGNPLEQDLKMGYFILIPESAIKKMLWSVLGSTLCCLLDLLPGLILGTILLGASPAAVMAWIPFILTVDLFATLVGSFIDLSVPVKAGSMVKQFMQILFVYFGLIPDAAILSVGIVGGHTLSAAIGAALLNLLLALIFLLLSAVYLEPSGGKRVIRDEECCGDPKEAKKVFSFAGFSVFLFLLIASAVQIGVSRLLSSCFPEIVESELAYWLLTFVPIYAIAFPITLLLLRKGRGTAPVGNPLPVSQLPKLFLVCIFGMYVGNLVGSLVNALLSTVLQLPTQNAIATYTMSDSLPLKLLFLVILAPMIEEFLFRKLLIDRMHPYGGALAVVTSAAMFGLFHGNFAQLFYAFAVGLVFGYVYLKTGKLRYSIGLHMVINFLGSILGPAALSGTSFDDGLITAGNFVYLAYAAGLLLCALFGLILLITNRRRLSFAPGEKQLPAGTRFRAAWLNPGMLLLLAGCLALILLSLLAPLFQTG